MTDKFEYEITDIDYWEQDALLKAGDLTIYFQFSDNTRKPTIYDALLFLKNDSRFNTEAD